MWNCARHEENQPSGKSGSPRFGNVSQKWRNFNGVLINEWPLGYQPGFHRRSLRPLPHRRDTSSSVW